MPKTMMPAIEPPTTRAEIIAQFRQLHEQSMRFWATFDDAKFCAPFGTAWSPADHVRHLTRVMRALTKGLSLGRIKLWLAFGRARSPSRTYDEIRDTYLSRLPEFTGPNPFAPKTEAFHDAMLWRGGVMGHYDAASRDLIRVIERWSEPALDRYRLPHMLLGKLTLREMLFFVLYHNLHHIEVVARRS